MNPVKQQLRMLGNSANGHRVWSLPGKMAFDLGMREIMRFQSEKKGETERGIFWK